MYPCAMKAWDCFIASLMLSRRAIPASQAADSLHTPLSLMHKTLWAHSYLSCEGRPAACKD